MVEHRERASVRAWLLLGTAHAECDDRIRAVQALAGSSPPGAALADKNNAAPPPSAPLPSS